jgi:hypothetical protein
MPHCLLVVEWTHGGKDPDAVDLLVVSIVAGYHLYGDGVT